MLPSELMHLTIPCLLRRSHHHAHYRLPGGRDRCPEVPRLYMGRLTWRAGNSRFCSSNLPTLLHRLLGFPFYQEAALHETRCGGFADRAPDLSRSHPGGDLVHPSTPSTCHHLSYGRIGLFTFSRTNILVIGLAGFSRTPATLYCPLRAGSNPSISNSPGSPGSESRPVPLVE